MQKHEFAVNQLLCNNSHGCCWWGLHIPTPLAEVGPLRGQQGRQTLRKTGKRNTPSKGMHPHSPLVLPECLLYLSELSEWRLPASLLMLRSHCWAGAALQGSLFPTAGAVTGPMQPGGRGFGLWMNVQLIQTCFDKAKRFGVKALTNCNDRAVGLIVEPVQQGCLIWLDPAAQCTHWTNQMRTFPQSSSFIVVGLSTFCYLISSKTSSYQFSLKGTFLP